MTDLSRIRGHFSALMAGLLLLIAACAEIQAPPGGPPDKTAPSVDSTIPVSGSVNVPVGRQVDIYFSEDVLPGQGRQVFISPRPDKDPVLKWHGDRLTVRFPEDFRPNQTYVVSLNTTLADLHGNRLDSALSVAFSTGPVLDSGSIAGTILLNGATQAGTLVALYADTNLADSLVYDSVYPSYLTASGAGGYFRFQFLPDREFRMVAFADKNRDDRFNPLRESFAVPDRPIIVNGPLGLDSLLLQLTAIDTSHVEIVSAGYSQNNIIRARLSKEISLDYLKVHLDAVHLISAADSTLSIPALDLGESHLQKAATLTLYFGKLSEGTYRLSVQPSADAAVIHSGDIVVRPGKDNESPTIAQHTPSDKPIFASAVDISVTFSEPIDTAKLTGTSISLRRGTDTLAVPVRLQWPDLFHVAIVPDTVLAGTKYRMDINEFDILDLAGNPLGDSITSFQFSTLNVDSLGTISGAVEVALQQRASDPVVIVLRELQNRFLDTLALPGKSFLLDVPAGRYILSGYIDSNKDGKYTNGSVWPYRFAETTALHPDTVAVRARFETAEIVFRFK